MMQRLCLGICLAASMAQFARADEELRIIAQSGSWIARAHTKSMLEAPDMCAAYNSTPGGESLIFMSDKDGLEVRYSNSKWSLPSGVSGSIMLTIDSFTASYGILRNNSEIVSARVPPGDVLPIFKAMDDASAMYVVVGNSGPRVVSLSGSTKATNAFRTCAGIQSNAASPGSNPFK